jgi:hypothetical protein
MDCQKNGNVTLPIIMDRPSWNMVFEPTFFDKALDKARKAGGIVFGVAGVSGLMATTAYEIGMVKVIVGVTMTASLSMSVVLLSTALIVMGIAIYRLKTTEDMTKDVKKVIDDWAVHYVEKSKQRMDDQTATLLASKKRELAAAQNDVEGRRRLVKQLDDELERLEEKKENERQNIHKLQNDFNRLNEELAEKAKEVDKELKNLRLRLKNETDEIKACVKMEQEGLNFERRYLLDLPQRPLFLQRKKIDPSADLALICKEDKQIYFHSEDFFRACDVYYNSTRTAMREGQEGRPTFKCEDGKERVVIFFRDYHETTFELLKDYLYDGQPFVEVSAHELIELFLLSSELQITDLNEICEAEIRTMIEEEKFSLESLFIIASDGRFTSFRGAYESKLIRNFIKTKYANLSDLSKVDLSLLSFHTVRKLLDKRCYTKGRVQKFYFLIQWAIQSQKESGKISRDEKEKIKEKPSEDTLISVTNNRRFETLLRFIELDCFSYRNYVQVFSSVKEVYGEILERDVRLACQKFLASMPLLEIQSALNFLPFFEGDLRQVFLKQIIIAIAGANSLEINTNTFFHTEDELKLSHLGLKDLFDLVSNLKDVSTEKRDFFALRLILNWVYDTCSFIEWEKSFASEEEKEKYIEEKKKLLSTCFEGKNGAQVQIWDFVNFDRIDKGLMDTVDAQLKIFFPEKPVNLAFKLT